MELQLQTAVNGDFSFGRDYATLSDNFDNTYKRIGFGGNDPVGRAGADSIYPGESASDVLIFERPLGAIEYLDLEMPASNFGGTGMLRLRIASDMLEDAPE